MVGKIKNVRQKLHQNAVKLTWLPTCDSSKGSEDPISFQTQQPSRSHVQNGSLIPTANIHAQNQMSSSPSIFSGTEIAPEALRQTLTFKDLPAPPISAKTGPVEEKNIKSKKEKMKERRERWLSKISTIKLAKERLAAQARRKATPIVGDMSVLAEALPELSELISPATTTHNGPTTRRKNKLPVKKCAGTDFSQMRPLQKRKLLESEISRFGEAVKILSGKRNPLNDISEHLRKRLKHLEEESS
ncbi:protein FAM207A [Corythoichthys intestinalis]|uniref:protein FAM207A n=1 Tax=Corythoichthys intestinalis TaxID=161448 RepID=UPI0025A5BB38|nr:protein FAM207A [Corythoichthys intestinalis]XP_057685954.1 protein FAM207A [Corythoichthys intestinalis]